MAPADQVRSMGRAPCTDCAPPECPGGVSACAVTALLALAEHDLALGHLRVAGGLLDRRLAGARSRCPVVHLLDRAPCSATSIASAMSSPLREWSARCRRSAVPRVSS